METRFATDEDLANPNFEIDESYRKETGVDDNEYWDTINSEFDAEDYWENAPDTIQDIENDTRIQDLFNEI